MGGLKYFFWRHASLDLVQLSANFSFPCAMPSGVFSCEEEWLLGSIFGFSAAPWSVMISGHCCMILHLTHRPYSPGRGLCSSIGPVWSAGVIGVQRIFHSRDVLI